MRNDPDYERRYVVLEEELRDIRKKHCGDMLQRISPGFSLETIHDIGHAKLIKHSRSASIYTHRPSGRDFVKLVADMPHPIEKVLAAVIDPANYPRWNDQVGTGRVNIRIPSENALVASQKHQGVGRGREFVYLRHLFQKNGVIYLVDKSIEHASVPSDRQVLRGEIKLALWAFEPIGLNCTRLICMADMDFKIKAFGGGSVAEPTVSYLMATAALSNYL